MGGPKVEKFHEVLRGRSVLLYYSYPPVNRSLRDGSLLMTFFRENVEVLDAEARMGSHGV